MGKTTDNFSAIYGQFPCLFTEMDLLHLGIANITEIWRLEHQIILHLWERIQIISVLQYKQAVSVFIYGEAFRYIFRPQTHYTVVLNVIVGRYCLQKHDVMPTVVIGRYCLQNQDFISVPTIVIGRHCWQTGIHRSRLKRIFFDSLFCKCAS